MRHNIFKLMGRVSALAMVCVGFSACSNSSPRLYTLSSENGPVVVASGPTVVEVVTPVIPSRLDRDTIVLGDHGYQMRLAHGDSWSEPLAEMIAHVVASDLAQRLPSSHVYAQNDAVTASPTALVEITLRKFEGDQQGHSVVNGALTVHRRDGTGGVLLKPFEWHGSEAATHDTARLVAELSQGLGAMANVLAGELQSLPQQ